jgi:hypothetical protein
MADDAAVSEPIDFDNAAVFLQQAREAHERGDERTCQAAVRLIAISLNLTMGPKPVIHTRHLKGG